MNTKRHFIALCNKVVKAFNSKNEELSNMVYMLVNGNICQCYSYQVEEVINDEINDFADDADARAGLITELEYIVERIKNFK